MLDGVIDYLPSPLDIPPVKGTDPKRSEPIVRKASDKDEPFFGASFQIAIRPICRTTYLLQSFIPKR